MNHPCLVTGALLPAQKLLPLQAIRPALLERMRADYPVLAEAKEGYIATSIVNEYRRQYLAELLQRERGEMSHLEQAVLESLHSDQLLTQRIEEEQQEDDTLALGQKLADGIARFGGSWTFILSFFGFLVAWMLLNILWLHNQGFDPYPFILLNLVLSCLASIQAPLIMMSQNRQEARDRSRSESDYQVNLKAELEIRLLHEKLDHALNQQHQRLLEIQAMQLDMLEELLERSNSEKKA